MHISTAARELDFSPPSILAAQSVALVLEQNGAIDRVGLLSTMEAVHGTPAADGSWSLRDAYDVLELAQVLFLQAAQLPVDPVKRLAQLSALTASLPTHTVRSEQQIALQQFSTPAPIAYLTTLAAGISASDIVLEPSAGTGLLAVFAKLAGARLILNELDRARAEMLECAFPESLVTRHDAEMIDDLLIQDQRPSAVLINPPFSRSVGRGVDSLAGFRHLRAALLRLAPAGRCAAILSDRIDTTSQAWNIATQGCGLTLYLELPANAYAKHGTSQPVKIVVLQKGSTTKAKLQRCDTLFDALNAILALNAPASPAMLMPAPRAASPSTFGGFTARARLATPAQRLVTSSVTRTIDYTVLSDTAPIGEASGVYLPYRPSRIAIGCATPHPTALVESLAMGSIAAPIPAYVPQLPAAIIDARVLSDAQLETLIYAGAAFERDLPGRFTPAEEGTSLTPSDEGRAYRTGFFLGDGTGAGKGRQVASIMLDQWLRGHRKHVWISKTETLLEDARRDWTAVGGLALDIQHLNQWKLGTPVSAGEGILFLTYATLRSNRGDRGTRLEQILEYVGTDFDGMIVFD